MTRDGHNYAIALAAVESILNNDRISNAQDAPDALEALRRLPRDQKDALIVHLLTTSEEIRA